MTGEITIYNPNERFSHREVIITKEAVHEEELMKSDFVRLSWVSDERYVIPSGSYITPYPNVTDISGNIAHFTLYEDYQPEKTANGYKYLPEFQHPKMWLGYVPYYFTTQDAEGTVIKKTKYNYVGSLKTILADLCNFINRLYGLPTPADPFVGSGSGTSFLVNPVVIYDDVDDDSSTIEAIPTIDITQTVSWTFEDVDVLSAIDGLAKVCECEWHIDWDQRLIHFGSIKLGLTDYELVSDYMDDGGVAHVGNVGIPSVTRSSDKHYNSYLVHGSSRNNTRQTEHGNIAVDAPLLLDETTYPDSIIDLRAIDNRGNRIGPQLTSVLNIDSVYPHYELYLYDLVERHKYKVNDKGENTGEQWSVWYAKLARKVTNVITTFSQFLLTDNDVQIKVRGKYAEMTHRYVVLDLYFVNQYFKNVGYDQERSVPNASVTWAYGGANIDTTLFIGTTTQAAGHMTMEVDDTQFASISVGDTLMFTDGFNVGKMPSEMLSTRLVDGLPPTLAMQINDEPNTGQVNVNSLGTREFELRYISDDEVFNSLDDVENIIVASMTNVYTDFVVLNLSSLEYTVNPNGVTFIYDGEEYEQVRVYDYHDSLAFSLTDQSIQEAFTPSVGDTITITYGVTRGSVDNDHRNAYRGDTITAGYYEIIKVEEGSDKLVIPTTSQQGIVPRQVAATLGPNVAKNSKATIFNITVDSQTKLNAQAELEQKALEEIAKIELDTNNYTFKSNVVDFNSNNPNLYIGRRVHFFTDGLSLHTRVLKLTTKLDYGFDQEITVGNQIVKGRYARLNNELQALQNDFNNWMSGGTGTSYESIDVGKLIVDRGHWKQGEQYYFEAFNRNTSVYETSKVTNYGGAVWHCTKTLTTQEPVPGCTDWILVENYTVTYKTYDSWNSTTTYYYEGRSYAIDEHGDYIKDEVETSRVYHYGLWWECRRTGTSEQPHYGAHDWVVVGGSTLRVMIKDLVLVNTSFHETLRVDRADGETVALGIMVYHGTENVTITGNYRFNLARDDSNAAFASVYSQVTTAAIPSAAIFGGMVTINGVTYDMRRSRVIEGQTVYEVAPKGTVSVTVYNPPTGITIENAELEVRRVMPEIEVSEQWSESGDYHSTTRLISQVWNYGILWQCDADGTHEEPSFGCNDWIPIGGNNVLTLDFLSSRGYMFRRGAVETAVTPYLYFGNEEISAKVAAENWNWTRTSEHPTPDSTTRDQTWNAAHSHLKTLELSNTDMDITWSSVNKQIFTLTISVNDGSNTIIVENQIIS